MSAGRIPSEVRERVRARAGNRCEYCQSPQDYTPVDLEVDHILPQAVGGTSDEDNLCLACPTCNRHKSAKTHGHDPETDESTRLFNPRHQRWTEHFKWSEDGAHIIGITPCGRATVVALNLNKESIVHVRLNWVAAGWHPPQDAP